MLENEKQRRWWFANHPEYSNSRKGAKQQSKDDETGREDKPSPQEVDEYVDYALQHVDGPLAVFLQLIKKNFGTEAEDQQNKAKSAAPTSADQTSHARYRVSGLRKYSNEELRRMGIPTPEEQALVSDPHTFLDVTPYKRYITSPVQTLKRLFRSKAEDAIVYGAKKGGNRPPPRLPPKGTPERNAIEAAREQGIRLKRAQELKDIKAGGKGSGVWTEEELAGIRNTGKWPNDAVWHHDPTVANRPDLAADPRSVHLMRGGRKAHLRDGHQGNYQNPRIDVPKKDSPSKD